MLKPILTSLIFLLSIPLLAQEQLVTAPKYQRHDVYFAPEVHENANLILEVPFLDLPYLQSSAKTIGNTTQPAAANYFGAYANPGMNIALGLTYSTYASVHYGLKRAVTIDNKFWHNVLLGLGVGAADLGLHYTPLGSKWLHNEYVKSIMSVNGINGQNEMNYFTNNANQVTHVSDQALTQFKANNNAAFVRMQAAGMEGEYLLIDKLQRNNFFYKSNLPNLILYWFTTIKNVNLINNQSDATEANKSIANLVSAAGNNPSQKDYVGLAFTSWVYDLFNPTAQYKERGKYSEISGVDRYISPDKLNKAEQVDYMRKHSMLHYINCISPLMFGIKGISVKKDDMGNQWRLNFTGRHIFTSFGNDVSAKVYYQTPAYNWVFTLHNYNNFNHTFQGLETELVDVIVKTEKKELEFSIKAMVWGQPKNNDFKTSDAQAGGLVGIKMQYPFSKIIRPYIDIEAKSAGWVAGNPYLGNNMSIRLGLNAVFGGQ
jgi:hypothetical protein